jgi:hypothetical protein
VLFFTMLLVRNTLNWDSLLQMTDMPSDITESAAAALTERSLAEVIVPRAPNANVPASVDVSSSSNGDVGISSAGDVDSSAAGDVSRSSAVDVSGSSDRDVSSSPKNTSQHEMLPQSARKADSPLLPYVPAASSISVPDAPVEMNSSTRAQNCKTLLGSLGRPGKQKCNGWYNIKNRKTYGNLSDPRRIAVVIRGESFRRNSAMYDRNIEASKESIKCQMEASASHMKQVIEPFESCGLEVHVFLTTWKPEGSQSSQAMKMLVDAYKGRIIWKQFDDHKAIMKQTKNIGQATNFDAALASVAKWWKYNFTSYDAILIIRADLIFKQPLLGLAPLVGNRWKHVLFAFHEWEMGGGFPQKVPKQRLPDTIFWIPWRFANCVVSNGWQEHNWASVSQFVGDYLGLLMDNEYHDANTQADKNPLYSQACRKEQKFDIHGGPAVGAFSVVPQNKSETIAASALSIIKTFWRQGDPSTIPVMATSLHTWTTGKLAGGFCKVPDFCPPSGKQAYSKMPPNYLADASGWFAWHESIKKSAGLLWMNGEFRGRLASNPAYNYDRVAFVRDDYIFRRSHISLYEYVTRNQTFVGFGSKLFPSVPSLIVLSHRGLSKLIGGKPPDYAAIPRTVEGAIQHLTEWFGLPVRMACEAC